MHEENRLYRLVLPLLPAKLRPLADRYWETLTYLFFGAASMLVNYLVFFLTLPLLGYLVANIAAWCFAVAFAFVTNKCFVFEDPERSAGGLLRQLATFTAARLFSLGLEELLLWLLVEKLGWGEGVTKLLTSVLTVVLNYFFSKLLIFRRRPAAPQKTNPPAPQKTNPPAP